MTINFHTEAQLNYIGMALKTGSLFHPEFKCENAEVLWAVVLDGKRAGVAQLFTGR